MKSCEFKIKKSNGQRIAAKAFLPGNGESQYPTAIFSHGFGGCYKDLEHHGIEFSDAGVACIFIDFCGGGLRSESDGSMMEMTVLTEMDDLLEAFEQIKQMNFVLAEHISLIGESQGGFVSAMVAARLQEQVKKLVLWYPAFIIPEDSQKRYAVGENVCFGTPLSPDYNAAARNIDVYSIIPAYKGPVKILHGDQDAIVPLKYSQTAAEAYDNASLLVFAGAGHGFTGEDSKKAGRISAEFIAE